MSEGLNRDEDTALRCLVALAESGHGLSMREAELYARLRARDRRDTVRREGTKIVPSPRDPNEVTTPAT